MGRSGDADQVEPVRLMGGSPLGRKKQKHLHKKSPSPSLGTVSAKVGQPLQDELHRQLQEAHTAAAWGKAIAIWRQMTHGRALSQQDQATREWAAEAFFQHGVELDHRGTLESALLHCKTAVELHPSSSHYRYHLALTFHRIGQWENAMASYAEVLRVEPDHERAAYHLCLACLQSGQGCNQGGPFDRGLQVLIDQPAAPPLPWPVRRLLAWRDYVRSGSTSELNALFAAPPPETPSGSVSVLSLEAALVSLTAGRTESARRRLPPPDTELGPLPDCIASIRTILSARAGHHRQAQALGERLQRGVAAVTGQQSQHKELLDSLRMRALWEAGLAVWWQGERENAVRLFQGALDLDPKQPAVRHSLALALETSGVTPTGKHWQELAKAWERDWRRRGVAGAPEQRMAMGLVYQRTGESALREHNWPEARRHLARAAALAPEQDEIWYSLAHLATLTGDKAWLQSNIPHIWERWLNDALRLTELGHMCEEIDLEHVAEPIWSRLLKLDPEHDCAGDHLATLFEDRGKQALNQGDPSEALRQFEQGLKQVPDAQRLHIWLGGIHLLAGDRKLAVAAFHSGSTGRDDRNRIAYAEVEVGKHLLCAGLKRDAEAAFKRGLKADNNAELYLGIGLAYLEVDDLNAALVHFKEAGRRSGQHGEIIHPALAALVDRKAHEAAQDLLEEALAANPDDYALWTVRAFTEYSLRGPQMDKTAALRARTLALRAGDRAVVQNMDQILNPF